MCLEECDQPNEEMPCKEGACHFLPPKCSGTERRSSLRAGVGQEGRLGLFF